MPVKVSDEQFLECWNRHLSASAVSKELDLSIRAVHLRRRSLENKNGQLLRANHINSPTFVVREHAPRVDCEMENGTIIVASDAHYWPGHISIAHQALVKLIPEIKPSLIVLNGDMFDGAGISRFPKSSWMRLPTVKEELEAVSDRLQEIRKAAKPGTKFWWCLGNHDMRFEQKLVAQVPEYEGVGGFCLKDHFPEWPMSISLYVNQNLMIKHRFRNGVHATWNNTLYSGVSMVTGHLHRLQATLLADYHGPRWGIDCGTLADTDGDHMHYGEDSPMNHCSGFSVITIVDGQMIHPEFCSVINGVAYFRGKAVK